MRILGRIQCAGYFICALCCLVSAGADAAPIAIDTIDELQLIGHDAGYPLNGQYILTQDLDADDTFRWNAGDGFDPIGNYVSDDLSVAFTGAFDGQGHRICDLHIYRPTETSVGLFGCIRGTGEVANVLLSSSSILGGQYTGGIVGRSEGIVEACRFRGTVSGSWYVGGLVGRNSGTISQCSMYGSVTGTDTFVGGVTGRNYSSLLQCFSAGNATGNDGVGGLAGSNSGSVTECLSVGKVTGGTGTAIGGLLGSNNGTVTRCYWDVQTSQQAASAGGSGLASAVLQAQATFTGWDFEDVWGVVEGWSYPYLRAISVPYEIDSIEQLQLIGVVYPLDGDYILTQDLDATATAGWDTNKGFSPIGNDSSASAMFSGCFFGMGHVIEGLTINRPAETGVGLFGCIGYHGEVSGLGIEDCTIVGDYWVGGLAGNSYGKTRDCYTTGSVSGTRLLGGLIGSMSNSATNCHSSASVTGSGDNIGGLVGSSSGDFEQCYATGPVSGDGLVGGLVGYCVADLHECYATGSVTGTAGYIGGLVGNANGGSIALCFATGSVSAGDHYAGGLVGASDAEVFYSYATGAVSGTTSVGGLIGGCYDLAYHCYSSGHVSGTATTGGLFGDLAGEETYCYWDTQHSGMATSDGGTGLTTAAMMLQASFPGWDFTNIWGIDETDSYPYLLAFYPIRVASPSGGEIWGQRTTHEITWTHAPDSGSHVKIKLFMNEEFDRWIAGSTSNDGSYTWRVPKDLMGWGYRIQIYSVSDFSMIDLGDQFTVGYTGFTISSPNGGESWAPGSKHTITWSHGAGSGVTVKIKLYKGGVFNRWICGGTENDGSFSWRLPVDLPLADDYEVQIYSATDSNRLDFSNAYFSVDEPDIQLLYPNGGDRFLPGDPLTIAWTSLPSVGPDVKIKLFKGGAFYSWISGPTANDGQCQTYIPLDAPEGDDYAIQIYSATDFTQLDFSDNDFSVTPNRLRITSPNGGENRSIDRACAITWNSAGVVGADVKLKLFKGGAYHSWISGPTPNDGAFTWTIPGTVPPGTDYTIQLYSAVDTTIVDFSDRTFSITEPGIRVITPNGGETWAVNATQAITWASGGGVDDVKIKLFKGGTFNRWISGPTPNDGVFSWDIPADATAGTNYKVQIYSAADFDIIDSSNTNFTISTP